MTMTTKSRNKEIETITKKQMELQELKRAIIKMKIVLMSHQQI